jgi:hypothetical protein
MPNSSHCLSSIAPSGQTTRLSAITNAFGVARGVVFGDAVDLAGDLTKDCRLPAPGGNADARGSGRERRHQRFPRSGCKATVSLFCP